MDRTLIVMNKPPGLVAQGGRTRAADPTVEHVLDDLTLSLELKERPLTVHRLDKPTTGALLLARNKQTAQTLSQQLRDRDIQKTYLALVRGSFIPGDADKVRQHLYITDGKVSHRENPMKAPTEVRDTLTLWKCLGTSVSRAPAVSLLEFGLHTGVKHQLRVCAATALKAPILGDHVHDSMRSSRILPDIQDRLMLHSARVNLARYLRKPLNGRRKYRLEITAPLPADFVSTCKTLGIPLDPTWTPDYVHATVNGRKLVFKYEEISEDDITNVLGDGKN